MLKVVVGFNSILYKVGVPLYVIGHVLSHSEVVHPVNGNRPIVRLMNGVTLDVGEVNNTRQVKVNGVPSQLKLLPAVVNLDVGYSRDELLSAVGMHL